MSEPLRCHLGGEDCAKVYGRLYRREISSSLRFSGRMP